MALQVAPHIRQTNMSIMSKICFTVNSRRGNNIVRRTYKYPNIKSLNRLVNLVEEYYNLPCGSLASNDKHDRVSIPRHIYVYLACRHDERNNNIYGASLKHISGLISRKHSNAINSRRFIEAQLTRDEKILVAVKAIEQLEKQTIL